VTGHAKAGLAGEPGWLCRCRRGKAVRGFEEDLVPASTERGSGPGAPAGPGPGPMR
jgi:hypothetical protein